MKSSNKNIFCCLACIFFAITGFSVMADTQNVFNYIPKSCNIVGNVNLKEIKTIKSVGDAINKTQNDPIYECLKSAGLTADNIDDVTYGMQMKSIKQNNPSFIALLQTFNKADIKKFVQESSTTDKNIVITSTNENGKEIYEYTNKKEKKQQPVFCVAINDNLIAFGTKDFIGECAKSDGNKSESILTNEQIMKLINDEGRTDMVWLAAIIPSDFNQTKEKESKLPNIKNGILAFNYKNSNLILTGELNCATPQDVQKVMLPVQMFLGIFAMNPNTGIDPQDISLNPKGTNLTVDIKIPEKAIEAILKTQKGPAVQTDTAHAIPESANGVN